MVRNYCEQETIRRNNDIPERPLSVDGERKAKEDMDSHIAALRQLVDLLERPQDNKEVLQSALGILIYRIGQLGIIAQLELKHHLLPSSLLVPQTLPDKDIDNISIAFSDPLPVYGSYQRREELGALYLKNRRLIDLLPETKNQLRHIIDDLTIGLGLQVFYRQIESSKEATPDEMRRRVRFLAALTSIKDGATKDGGGTSRHIATVCANSHYVARKLFPQDEIEPFIYGALLHDLGKLGVPQVLLKLPRKLFPDEETIVRSHVSTGELIASNAALPNKTVATIAAHHENPNGKGYPRGLKNGQITLGAQIVRVVDTIDAMTAPDLERPWRKPFPADEVIKGHLPLLVLRGVLDDDVVAVVRDMYNKGELILPDSSYIKQRRFRDDPLLGKTIPSREEDFG